MSGFPILDLVAGMIFIFFLLSIICSSAVEMVLTAFKLRARMLEKWLIEIFEEQLAKEIMNHSTVTGLSDKDRSTSYIDARNFTTVLLDKISFNTNLPNLVPAKLDDMVALLQATTLLKPELKRALLVYAAEARESYRSGSGKTKTELEIFRAKIESWFDSSMDRVSGALKSKYSRKLTFWLGVLVVISLNADSIAIAKYLYRNPEARVAVAQKAYDALTDSALTAKNAHIVQFAATVKDSTVQHNADSIKNAIVADIASIKATQQLLRDNIPLGWTSGELNDTNGRFSAGLFFTKIAGLIATILAIMMGAPFWFEVLNKIANLRGTGKKPDTTDASAAPPATAAPVTVTVQNNPAEEAVG